MFEGQSDHNMTYMNKPQSTLFIPSFSPEQIQKSPFLTGMQVNRGFFSILIQYKDEGILQIQKGAFLTGVYVNE